VTIETTPPDIRDPAATLLEQAHKIVTGARRQSYGTPEDNFTCIADLWQVYLERRFPAQVTHTAVDAEPGGQTIHLLRHVNLTATDIAAMMVLMKVARLAETPNHADSWRDVAGYAACGARASGADLTKGAP
jgi:hypothetical protein